MTHQHSRVLIRMLGGLPSEPAPKTDTTPGLIQKYEAAKLTVANCVSDMYTPWGHSAVKQLVQEKVSRVVAYHAQPMQYSIQADCSNACPFHKQRDTSAFHKLILLRCNSCVLLLLHCG